MLGVALATKLTFETHLREVVSKAPNSLGIVRRIGKLLDCLRVFKGYSMHMFCPAWSIVPMWTPSAESQLGLLNSIVRSAERLCEGQLCYLAHRKKVGTLCLLYGICH